MANISDIFKQPKLDSTKFLGLPLGKADSDTGNKFITAITQNLLVSPHKGIRANLPDEVEFFFMSAPLDNSLGSGFSMTRTGYSLAWVQPKAEVGDMYKHIKPPKIPVYESKDDFESKLQASVAIRTHEMMRHWNQLHVPTQVVAQIVNQTVATINATIIDFWLGFWITVLGAGKSFVSDAGTLIHFRKKSAAADNTGQQLLKEYQEAHEKDMQLFITRAKKIKNFRWYDTTTRANWWNKQDLASIELTECKAPNMGADLKTALKALYIKTAANKTTLPPVSRAQCLFSMLKKIEATINRMTTIVPKYNNWVGFDSSKEVANNDEVQMTRCDRSDLIIVVSEWDYSDLMNGVSLTGSNNDSASLASVASGVKKIIAVPGALPGFCYIGEDWILKLMIELSKTTQVYHDREEENQWTTNFWLRGCSFDQGINGCVIGPCGNFTAPGEFYEEFSKLLKEA